MKKQQTSDSVLLNAFSAREGNSPDTLRVQVLNVDNQDLTNLTEAVQALNNQEKFLNKISYDALASVIIAIGIFFLGFALERLVTLISRHNRRKDTSEVFNVGINNLIRNLDDLASSYEKVSKETNMDTGFSSTPPQLLSIFASFKQINSLSFQELFDSISTKKSLTNLYNRIAYSENLVIEVARFHAVIYKDSSELRNELAKEIDEYFDLLDDFVDYYSNKRREDLEEDILNLLELIKTNLKRYYKEIAGTRKVSMFYSEILTVIQQQIVENKMSKHIHHSKVKEVELKGRLLSHKYFKVEDLVDEYCKQYSFFHTLAKRSSIDLKENKEKLQGKSFFDFMLIRLSQNEV